MHFILFSSLIFTLFNRLQACLVSESVFRWCSCCERCCVAA